MKIDKVKPFLWQKKNER